MTNALRLLLTLFTILSSTTICNASTQEVVRGVVFGKIFAPERETNFSTDFIAPKSETFYRVMGRAEADALQSGRALTVRGENFVTQDLAYAQQLAARHPKLYSEIVEFQVQAGTRQALVDIGARNSSKLLIDEGLGHLPLMQKGMRNAVHVKGEGTAINFGLREGSVDVFNSRILDFMISPIK